MLPVSFLSAADGQTESRMYWSFETPCSSVAVSIHLSMSGWPLRVDDAGQLGRVGDLRVQILLGDRDVRLGQRLLQQQVRNLDVQHLLAVPQQALLGQLLSTESARR